MATENFEWAHCDTCATDVLAKVLESGLAYCAICGLCWGVDNDDSELHGAD